MLVFLSILWSGTLLFNEIGPEALPPLTLVFVRVLIAALVLMPLLWYAGHSLPGTLAGWTPFMMMGLLNNVLPFSLLVSGQSYTTVGLTAIINAMTPLATILVMASFREEALTILRVIGVLLGVLGVAVLRGFDGQVEWDQTLGILLCLCGTLSYGFAALWARRNLAGIPPMKSATCQLISSSLILSVIVSIVDQPWTLAMPDTATWLALFALGVFSTALAYIVFFEILVRAGASEPPPSKWSGWRCGFALGEDWKWARDTDLERSSSRSATEGHYHPALDDLSGQTYEGRADAIP